MKILLQLCLCLLTRKSELWDDCDGGGADSLIVACFLMGYFELYFLPFWPHENTGSKLEDVINGKVTFISSEVPLGKKRLNQNKPCRLICHTFSSLGSWGRDERGIHFTISYFLKFQSFLFKVSIIYKISAVFAWNVCCNQVGMHYGYHLSQGH